MFLAGECTICIESALPGFYLYQEDQLTAGFLRKTVCT